MYLKNIACIGHTVQAICVGKVEGDIPALCSRKFSDEEDDAG